jgi:hypothetical protein
MLRGQAKVDPHQGFSGSDSQDKSKPEREPKNGNHFGIHRRDGRSFCGGGSDTILAVREQQQRARILERQNVLQTSQVLFRRICVSPRDGFAFQGFFSEAA